MRLDMLHLQSCCYILFLDTFQDTADVPLIIIPERSPVISMYSWPPDQPNIDVPEEIVSDEDLELTCYAPDNCPDMTPEIQWMYTDYLPDPEFSSDSLEESNTAVLSSTLTFTPRPMHNGQLLGCRVYYPNTTLVYERLISLDIKCKFSSTSHWETNN